MNKPRLFHISEQQDIARFDPRPAQASHHRPGGAVVWAVAEARLYNYLAPRQCPRVSFFARDATSEGDVATFLDGDRGREVLAVESAWFDRLLTTPLARYEFDPAHFSLHDACAGYYLSRRTEAPIGIEIIPHPLTRLLEAGVEVRLTPSLWALREWVLRSSLGFSFIRMRNAAPPAAGLSAFHPL